MVVGIFMKINLHECFAYILLASLNTLCHQTNLTDKIPIEGMVSIFPYRPYDITLCFIIYVTVSSRVINVFDNSIRFHFLGCNIWRDTLFQK